MKLGDDDPPGDPPEESSKSKPVASSGGQGRRPLLNAYLGLLIITLIRLSSYWQQKSLSFIYGFKGQGVQLGDPKYELSSAFYPHIDQYYGFLVGLCYTMPYAISGLFAGSLTRTFNRKAMLFTVISVMSLC